MCVCLCTCMCVYMYVHVCVYVLCVQSVCSVCMWHMCGGCGVLECVVTKGGVTGRNKGEGKGGKTEETGDD